jgi:hypothetical protein
LLVLSALALNLAAPAKNNGLDCMFDFLKGKENELFLPKFVSKVIKACPT